MRRLGGLGVGVPLLRPTSTVLSLSLPLPRTSIPPPSSSLAWRVSGTSATSMMMAPSAVAVAVVVAPVRWMAGAAATATSTDKKGAGAKGGKGAAPKEKRKKPYIPPPPLSYVALAPKPPKVPRGVGVIYAQERGDGSVRVRNRSLIDRGLTTGMLFNPQGEKNDQLLLAFDQNDIERVVRGELAERNRWFKLHIEGHSTVYRVLIQQWHIHPVNRRVLNVVLVTPPPRQPLEVKIPVILVGRGGNQPLVNQKDMLHQQTKFLEGQWDQKAGDDIPEAFYIDVSRFDRGSVYRVRHLRPTLPLAFSLSLKVNMQPIFSIRKFVRDKDPS